MRERTGKLIAGVAGLILAATSLGEPSHPSAAVSPGVGIVVHSLDQSSIDRLTDVGVNHVRFTLYWSHWGDAGYRTGFRNDIARATSAGIEPLIVVHQQPRGGYADRERVYRDFARFMEDRAREFPQVRAWQLWNEMDVAFTDVFGATRNEVSMRQRGRHYATMLHLAYPAIKRGNPQALVVTGGIASAADSGFIQGIYDGRGPFDVLAIHTYGFPVVEAFRGKGLATRRIMHANGDSRPIWNTEFGMEEAVVPRDWPRGRIDIDRYHRDSWRDSFLYNEQERLYERAYGYALQSGGDVSFDLIRGDGSARPAYGWLREWTRQRPR